MLKTPE
jgi:hypothetical protein